MARRARHEGHGGAWKVAYADFVTAMMALFLVLWLVGSDDETRNAVQRYFKGEKTQQGRRGALKYTRNKPLISEEKDKSSQDLMAIPEVQRAMEQIRNQFRNSSELGEDAVRFEFTADGLRITALDLSKKPFFKPGTAELTEFGSWVLMTTAWVIERYPFSVEVEGHSQREKEGKTGDSKSWDISTRRANTARVALEQGGVKPARFWRVAGYADRRPINEEDPTAEENRRISIILRMNGAEDVQLIRQALDPN